ncbi:hypothetical protein BDV3_000251 [Batrachochytrium dendrobatidis]|uniref:Uncharacterized protein n=1 Tax=Batrachochytrium dendrobatidis (strain JEL423) TaxID=403673 RepID=A0A177WAV5_BATDL|nr:hypothetical protein BDEG_21268 [Batrachochytrium dendrobatidis JEL423]
MVKDSQQRPTSSISFCDAPVKGTVRKPALGIIQDHSANTKSRAQIRTRNVELKPLDPQAALAVQPWSIVRTNIANQLATKNIISPMDLANIMLHIQTSPKQKPSAKFLAASSSKASYPQHSTSVANTSSITSESEMGPIKLEPTSQAQQGAVPAMSITIPHGFLPLRTLAHARSTIQSVIYIPNSSMFVSLDASHINLWKGGVRINKFSTQPVDKNNGTRQCNTLSRSSGNTPLPGIVAISKWVYLDKLRIFVIANTKLQLKILDAHFEELCSISNPKPVLSIEYIPSKNEIICGEIGSIRIWKIEKSSLIHKELFILSNPRAIIRNLEEEWVTFIYYERLLDRFFAVCDTSLYVYDYESGDRIDSFHNIHELAITCIVFYEPFEYIITGGKDGSIKIWNARKYLMFDFHEHFNAITGLLLVEKGCEASPGSVPVLLSSSLDATIRMWNFETGQSLYRLDTNLPCLGIAFIKSNHFYHYTKADIQLWNINRYQLTFAFFRSTPFIIKRVTHPTKPARILTAVADGSLKMISPVSGIVIGTGFPIHKDTQTKDVAWNMNSENLYSFNTNGDIVVYSCNANPFKIFDVWELSKLVNREKIECICGLDFYNHIMGISAGADIRIVPKSKKIPAFFLVAGTESGQIINLNLDQRGKQELLCQAHSARITMLNFDPKDLVLVSGAQDYIIKVWAVTSVDNRSPFGGSILSAMQSQNVPSQTISLSSIAVISINGFEVPSKIISLSMQEPKMAVPFNGGIVISSYSTDHTVTPGKVDQEQGGHVCAIASAYDFGLWASANKDGTVKIWDADNTIVREIQFGEPITCLCFANERNDLLVGVADQISIVRVQDYMTYPMLKQLVTRAYMDDESEIPVLFDPNLDFWEYRYEQELKQSKKVEDWHMQKEEVRDAANSEDQLSYLLQLPKQRRTNIVGRHNKRVFLARETTAFFRSIRLHPKQTLGQQLEPSVTSHGSTEVLSGATSEPYLAEYIQPTSPTTIKEIVIPEPQAVISESQTVSSEQQTVVPDPQTVSSEPQIVDSEDNILNKKQQESQSSTEPIKSSEADLSDLVLSPTSLESQKENTAAVTTPLLKPVNRTLIHQRMLRAHIALPNSTIIGEIQPVKQMRNRQSRQETNYKEVGDDNFFNNRVKFEASAFYNEDSKIASRKMSVKAAIEVARRSRPHRPSVFSSHFDNHQIDLEDDNDDASFQALQEEMLVEIDNIDEQVSSRKAHTSGAKSKKSKKSSHKKGKNDHSKGKSKSKAITVPSPEEILAEPIQSIVTPIDSTDLEVDAPSAESMPQPVTSVSMLTHAVHKSEEKPQSMPEKPSKNVTHSEKGSLSGVSSINFSDIIRHRRPSSHIEFHPLNPHVVNIAHQPCADNLYSTPHDSQSINVQRNSELIKPHRNSSATQVKPPVLSDNLQDLLVELQDVKLPLPTSTPAPDLYSNLKGAFQKFRKQAEENVPEEDEEEPADFVWKMFRDQKNSNDVANPTSPVNAQSQEEVVSKPLELTEIASGLTNILKNGPVEDQIQSSKALMSLFQTFGMDFKDPVSYFILPQIDQLNHEDPRVRIAMCKNISKFHMHQSTILPSLIYSLDDSSPDVVNAAIHGLGQLGITNTTMLQNAMVRLGMLKEDFDKTGIDVIERHKIKSALDHIQKSQIANAEVDKWVSSIYKNPSYFKRTDSYCEHLAGKFFPPDANNFGMSIKPLDIRQLDSIPIRNQPKGPALSESSNTHTYLNGWDVDSNINMQILHSRSKPIVNKVDPRTKANTYRPPLPRESRYTFNVLNKPSNSIAKTDLFYSSRNTDRLARKCTESRTMASTVIVNARAITAGYTFESQPVTKVGKFATPSDLVWMRPNTTGSIFKKGYKTPTFNLCPKTADASGLAKDYFPPL